VDGTNGEPIELGGQTVLRIGERGDKELLSEALRRLAVANGWWRADGSDSVKSAIVRADGRDLAELIRDLYAGLIELIESFTVEVTGIEVDGLLRGDSGLVTWATVLIEPLNRPIAAPAAIVDIERTQLGLEIVIKRN
jgi:hypothetical protein